MAQLLSNLPIGAKVKFGRHSINGEVAQDIVWRVVAKSHTGYPSNSVTIWADKVIDLRCFDAIEPQSSDAYIAANGNSSYKLSNLAQWLNSDANANEWYQPSYSYDTPPTYPNARDDTDYASRPGFLNLFTNVEKTSLLLTTVYVANSIVSQKVFLPSTTELGVGESVTGEGAYWGSHGANGASPTRQVYDYSKVKPSSLSADYGYWTRTAERSSVVVGVRGENETVSYAAANGYVGVRPVVNLSDTLFVSDSTDSEGHYTFDWNIAPDAPSIIAAPATIYGGKSNPISWTASSDPNGDVVAYKLECSVDGGEYTEVYSGTALTYAHLVPFGTAFVSYRVKATDPSGESSAYTVSDTKSVVNNNAPTISGADENLGVKSSGFVGSYTITDANSDAVTVTEAIDGVQIRALVATLNTPIPYAIVGNTWLTLPNGSHTFTIAATDGIDTTVRTYVFTKLVEGFTIQNSIPWVSTTRPSRIMLVITRNIPSGAKFKVEVCNNGLQGSPTWEDCTAAVESGLVHVFSNESNSAATWGVLVRVTVERNGAAGACYVSAIGGNFE